MATWLLKRRSIGNQSEVYKDFQSTVPNSSQSPHINVPDKSVTNDCAKPLPVVRKKHHNSIKTESNLPPSAPPRHKQFSKPVNIYNDLNRVSVKNDLPVNIQLGTVTVEEKFLQNDILIREESFVKNISGTNNGQNKRMSIFTSRYESSYEEAVIDSIYAERRRNFARHGRSHSDSAHAVVSTSSTSTSSRREKGNSGLFSFFRWFKKEKDNVSEDDDNDGNNNDDIGIPSIPASPKLIRGYSSSCGSVDTLFSTATANSFSFIHPSLYRPFGSACVPETRIASGPETETYRNRIRQRDRLRELDKNITLRKKYNLLGSDTIYRSADNLRGKYFTGNKSTDSLKESPASKNSTFGSRKKRKAPQPPLLERKHSDYSLPSTLEHISKDKNKASDLKNDIENRPRHRRTVSDSAKDKKAGAYCHVRGKRKAPPPPSAPLLPVGNDNSLSKVIGSSGKKKRPAPQPPVAFCSASTNVTKEDIKRAGSLTPEEKQRLIENIAKLQAHADKNNTGTPPSSPDLKVKSTHTICNDSLKLEKGILKANKEDMQVPEVKPTPSSPVSPRPWYKRSIISKDAGSQNGKSLEKKKSRDKGKSDEWMPEVGFPRRSIISTENNRFSNIFSKANEEKRKSQISMLVNISELDREAAEIVQKEQEREKAKLAEQNAKFYNSHVGSPVSVDLSSENKSSSAENVETPKRSSAKELISLFNAIGNVTKVTVNSAFFSKDGPSIFTKQGIEKRFSFVGEKTEEKVIVKESISQSNGYKRETVVIDTQETYLESPGVKRRKNLYNYDNTNEYNVADNDASSSSSNSSSDKYLPKVTIEELDAYDAEKTSKTQAMYEANRLRRHHSPSPSIPTIVEMSESVSSVATSPGSTINNNRTVTPEPLQHAKRVSFWICPRCTLENARWRVTCDACDLWRPVQDNMNDTAGTNDVATASIITQNVEKDKNLSKSEKIITSVNSIIENNINKNVDKIIENPLKIDSKIIGLDKADMKTAPNTCSKITSFAEKQPENNNANQKPNEKINNEADIDELRRVRLAFFDKTLDNENTTKKDINSESVVSNMNLPSQPNINDLQTKPTGGSSIATNEEERLKIKEMLKEMKNSLPKRQKPSSDNSKNVESVNGTSDSCMDKVTGNFGLHIDKEKLSSEKINISVNKCGVVNGNKDIAGNKFTNKSGLQGDGQKQTSSENIRNTKYDIINGEKDVHIDKITSNFGSHVDPTKLGAIRKVPLSKPFVEIDAKTKQNRNSIFNLGSKKDEKAEAYLVKSEMILEDIKVKKTAKVSTSVQTNGVINKVENHSATVINCDVGKPPVGKVTPKSSRKEFIVPVTVEEYKIKDGVLYTSLTKETKRIGTGTFELIRARDFASIEATKTGNEAVAVHVYANVPTSNTCVQEQTQWAKHPPASSVSISSETTEVEKLTAQLTQPKGLADFKAKLEGNKSIAADKMNTLAVNRLLRKLEAAIAGGQHHQAAVLAKELARLKINCSVTRHKETVNANIITIDMYVEDKVSHQGPIPLQISPSLTVAQLKLKVEKEFEIPVRVQRWILGKQLAVDDKTTLKQLSVDAPHCPVFLYLVAPEGGLEKPASEKNNVQEKKALMVLANDATNAAAALQQPEAKKAFYNGEDDRYSLCESDRTQQSSKEPSPEIELEEQVEIEEEEVDEEDDEIEIEIEEEEEEEEIEDRVNREKLPQTGTLTLGWKCPVCTLVNSPTRPGCLACTTARPVDYIVPAEYQASGAEMARLNMEEENQKEAAEEKMKHYQQLVNLENADLVVSTEPFECSVCFVNYVPGEGVVLRECLHTFCKACLAHTIQFSEEAEVKCPYRDEQYACDSTLQEREIKALVPPEIYEQHLAKSVAQAENKIGNAFHCKSPDCPGWCIFEDNVNIFNCPVCGKTNCLTCQAIHNGMNCKQYQEQVNEDSETNAEARRTKEMLQEMVERGEAMNCPTCQVVLMKKWGCDWLRCSMCKTEICWVTRGPRWGPGGKGDISGGCQCGVNGIKCHPRCNYCH